MHCAKSVQRSSGNSAQHLIKASATASSVCGCSLSISAWTRGQMFSMGLRSGEYVCSRLDDCDEHYVCVSAYVCDPLATCEVEGLKMQAHAAVSELPVCWPKESQRSKTHNHSGHPRPTRRTVAKSRRKRAPIKI